MTPLNRKILRDLWRIKAQALAIALIIGSGVAMYIMSLGTLYSLEETRDAYYERNRFAQVFTPLKRATKRLKANIAAIPGIKTVETRIAKDVTLDIPGFSEPASGRIISLPNTGEQMLNVLHLRQGWMPAVDRPGEVLVNEAFALANDFEPGSTFAAIINGHKRTLTIVGLGLLSGCALGTWLGRGMMELYANYFQFPFLYYIVDGSVYMTATLISIFVGTTGALTSVWRAERLTPTVAMTPPPPTPYRTAWIERRLGRKGLGEPTRMILRHVLRWPVRSGFGVMGTAPAVSILIGRFFFFDSLDRLVNIQFFQTQRQDVTLRFADARDASTMAEVARMPGIENTT